VQGITMTTTNAAFKSTRIHRFTTFSLVERKS
jgi:hypothetical protein